MAAAGPHLSLKSWGPLYQAVGVLASAALLSPTSRSSDPSRGGGDGDDGEDDDNELWIALEGVWEFIFLQARIYISRRLVAGSPVAGRYAVACLLALRLL